MLWLSADRVTASRARCGWVLLAVVTASLAGGVMASDVAAASTSFTYRVVTTLDAREAHAAGGRCADAAGQCTLRAAIEAADARPAGSTVRIVVPAGVYCLRLGTLTVGAGGGTALTVDIDGSGPAHTVITANHHFGVMVVGPSAMVTVERLTITGGNAGNSGYGGGVLSAGTLTLFDVELTGNRAAAGGGVANAGGSLVVTGSRIEGNNGGPYGGGGVQNGGPANLPGSVRIVSSVIADNVTTNEGGGIFSGQNGRPPGPAGRARAIARRCPAAVCRVAPAPTAAGLTLTVIDSDVVGNIGTNGGGGIAAEGQSDVIGSQVGDNSAGDAVGGGLFDIGLVRDSMLYGNSASSGGAVEVFPSVRTTIETSTLSGNHAAAYGGAIDESGSVVVDRSTLVANTSGGPFLGEGAAVILQGGAELRLTNSTVTGNTTRPAGGGAIFNYGGAATLAYDTLSDNSTSLTGGGYTTATATIFSAAKSQAACAVSVHETAGFNLDSDHSCGLALATDQSGTNPMLGPLAHNGGPTETEALLPGSPAIDGGGLPATAGCPPVDQRGASRPFGPACDVGAYERH